MPRAGKLRYLVTIQQATEAASSFGEPIATWATYAQRWAGVEPLSGNEFFAAGARQGRRAVRFWLRNDGLTLVPKMRVSHDSRVFDIDAVIPPEKKGGYLQLMTSEAI